MYTKERVRACLAEMAEDGYRKFTAKLIPTTSIDNIVGVRMPRLRRLALEILKSGDGDRFLREYEPQLLEEKLVYAYALGKIKLPYERKKELVSKYVPLIENWSECDCAVAAFGFIGENKEDFYAFVQRYFDSDEEYAKRFALYCYIGYYLSNEYIDGVIEKTAGIVSDQYYVNMASAYLLATAFIDYPDKVYGLLKSKRLTKFVQNKAISKIRESYRISDEDKARVGLLRIR